MLTSRQHPSIKLLRSLQAARERREQRLFVVEGRNAVAAALETRWPLREVLVAPDEEHLSRLAEERGVAVQPVSAELLAYASEAQTSPGVIALAEMPTCVTDWSLEGLLLVIDGVSDPGNIGTLLRAADAAGAEKVVLTAGSADPWAPKVVRSAAGSLFHLPPVELAERSPAALVEVLRKKQIPIVAAEAHGGESCFGFAWPERCALVLGHETRGISPEFQEAAAAKVNIPVYGRAESLNVAMAGTLLLYAWRQCHEQSSRD